MHRGIIKVAPGGRMGTHDFPNIIVIGSSNDSLPW